MCIMEEEEEDCCCWRMGEAMVATPCQCPDSFTLKNSTTCTHTHTHSPELSYPPFHDTTPSTHGPSLRVCVCVCAPALFVCVCVCTLSHER